MNITIETEQEASVALLFACVMHQNHDLTQSQVDQLSRILVMCAKFRSTDLNELTKKAIILQSQHDIRNVMEQCAPLISEEFKQTLFAMVCEMLTQDGQVNESKSEIIGMAALFLEVPVERMKMMLTTYLIRNKWNVQVIDEMHG
jgi:hypothetical protein